jgi:hypothetical protein
VISVGCDSVRLPIRRNGAMSRTAITHYRRMGLATFRREIGSYDVQLDGHKPDSALRYRLPASGRPVDAATDATSR